MQSSRNAHSSKHFGCLGGHRNGTATHGTSLVRNVLAGFRYDPATRCDREEDLRVAVRQLCEDLIGLRRKIKEHCDEYDDGVPEDVAHPLITLLAQGYDWSRDLDVDYATYLDELDAEANAVLDAKEADELWDFRNHYGCEPADFQGSVL